MVNTLVYVFVYGSLLSPNELRNTGIDVTKCKPALLRGYCIAFNKNSRGRCAAANLERCEDCEVVGIVCEVDHEVIKRLDERERGYRREHVICITLECYVTPTISAYVYVSDKRLSNNEIKRCVEDYRFKEYLKTIAKGIVYWNKRLTSFTKRYLSGIRGDDIHSVIVDNLRKLIELTK